MLESLRSFIQRLLSHSDEGELLKYFPIATVAILERYTRQVIKDLIDYGQPFLEKASKLSDFKFDVPIIQAISGRAVTFGELISHLVSINNLGNIINLMEALLGEDFKDNLKAIPDRVKVEIGKQPQVPILSNPDKVLRDVEQTFQLRHIFCHEVAEGKIITRDETMRLFESSRTFLEAMEALINETLDPGYPLTQQDMNLRANEQFRKADKELQDLWIALRKEVEREGHRLLQFEELVSTWTAYRDAYAQFEGDRYLGGSLAPLAHLNAKETITQQQIEEVKKMVEWMRMEG